jgi:hypothetical protein
MIFGLWGCRSILPVMCGFIELRTNILNFMAVFACDLLLQILKEHAS